MLHDTLLADILLVAINFLTSTMTGITGVGGGIILIALMPPLLPAAAIIPIHGATQFAGNASRAWFGRREILWAPVVPFLWGALAGAAAFAHLVRVMPLDFLPPVIGVYILLSLWSAPFNRLLRRVDNFFIVGFLHAGLGLFVGSPGPLAISAMHRRHTDNHVVVSTAAVMAGISHAFKVVVYGLAGFRILEYWGLVTMMIVAAVLGSYVGTRLRHVMDGKRLKRFLQWLLTVMAVQLLVAGVWRLMV